MQIILAVPDCKVVSHIIVDVDAALLRKLKDFRLFYEHTNNAFAAIFHQKSEGFDVYRMSVWARGISITPILLQDLAPVLPEIYTAREIADFSEEMQWEAAMLPVDVDVNLLPKATNVDMETITVEISPGSMYFNLPVMLDKTDSSFATGQIHDHQIEDWLEIIEKSS